ncbi:MAG TPA: DNA translocase FtsK [Desulfitobacteriaceae bacterium]|nr:DNA translocase FtsK [Desulfitobacteriaceae bacterium]
MLRQEITGIFIIGLACLGLAAVYTEKNGIFGKKIADGLLMVSGGGKVWLLLMIAVWGISLMIRKSFRLGWRAGGFILLWLMFLGYLQLNLPDTAFLASEELWREGLMGKGGGVIGASLVLVLINTVGLSGSYVILGMGALIGIILIMNRSLIDSLYAAAEAGKQVINWFKDQITDFLAVFQDRSDTENRTTTNKRDLLAIAPAPNAARGKKNNGRQSYVVDAEVLSDYDSEVLAEKTVVIKTLVENTEKDNEAENSEADVFLEEYEQEIRPDAQKNWQKGVSKTAGDNTKKLTGTPISRQVRDSDYYELPSPSLLQKSMKVNNQRLNKDLADNVKKLEETLASFGVKIKVTQVTQGPSVTRYEAQPAAGVKVSKITNLSDDIALGLAATHVRIEAPVPGKSVVGIEVPNKTVTAVQFRDVIESSEFQNSAAKISLALGKDITGTSVIADLTKMPHLLIAGATGSGKSVCINTIIHSILFKARPDEVKLLLVDPKMVELTNYNGIPHLIAPVVTDPKKAAGALKWIVTEMETRYELFAAAGVRDIVRYNLLRTQDKENDYAPLPYVVVIIDELADLMMVCPGEVEDAICRIAQMARAAGIHLIVATQRPSVDVITGLIKANIPSRIAFAVSSQTDSRTILDLNGAEKLLGRGDMLYHPMGAGKPLRVQGCYLADKEMEDVVKYLQDQAKPEYQELPDLEFSSPPEVEEEMDDLFYQAAQLFIENDNASVSLLQRRLRIGYTRAARLMDLLEEKGVVGGYEGSKPREVLLTRGQFELKYGRKEINDN